MNYIDIIIAIFLIFAFVRGIINGFFSEIAGLIAVIAGVYIALNYSFYLENYFTDASYIDWSETTINVVAFCATFLIVAIIIVLIGKVLTKIADITALGMLNKLLGGLFGVFKTALILSVLFILFDSFNKSVTIIDKKTLDDSLFYNKIKNVAPTIFPAFVTEDEDGNEKIILPSELDIKEETA